MLDDNAKIILTRILEDSTKSASGIEAIRFRADHASHLDLLDLLEAERYIDKRQELYFVRLGTLIEIADRTQRVDSLLFLCEFVFRELRKHYLDLPGEPIDFEALVDRVEQPKRKVSIGLMHITESMILAGWATDSDGEFTSVTPHERILKFDTFADVVKSQRNFDAEYRSRKSASHGEAEHLRSDHRDFMLRAIELARKCRSESGRTSPKVGAVAVRDGVVIGEAFRGELTPGEHAEYTLLERKLTEDTMAGSTLYVTLEPCTSRNEPKVPCAERIIDRRIARVFFGVLDPNPNIRGDGELRLREAGIAVHRFDSDLIVEIEELNRDFTRLHRLADRRQNAESEVIDPVESGAVGPNGYRVGYTEDGDKVEWIPDDELSGEAWPLLLRRNDPLILVAYNEFWNKVWWSRHQQWVGRLERGEEILADSQKDVFEKAQRAAKRIENRYGSQNLICDDFERGLLSGRMSALACIWTPPGQRATFFRCKTRMYIRPFGGDAISRPTKYTHPGSSMGQWTQRPQTSTGFTEGYLRYLMTVSR